MKYGCALLFFLVFIPFTGFSFSLELYKEVGINGSLVYLKNLGRIIEDVDDINSNRSLDNVIIFPIPKKATYLSASNLNHILQQKLGISVNIKGNGITLYPLYTRVLIQEVSEKIKTALVSMYPYINYYNIEVVYMKTPDIPKLPAGNFKMKVIIPGGKIDITKYARLEITEGNSSLYNESFPIKLLFHFYTYMAKNSFSQGHIIQQGDFIRKEMNSFTYPSINYITNINAFIGKKIAKFIKKNQKITISNIRL